MTTTPDDALARSPYRTIWNLSWPQVLMMLFHFCIGLADVWTAGRIQKEVQASLGIITQSLFFFLVLAMAVANGSVAAISQSSGAGLFRRVQRYVGLSITIALIFGAVILVAGLPIKHLLLAALQVPPSMRDITDYFLGVYLLLLPTYYMLIITNAVFRARRQVIYPLMSMGVVALINTMGDLGLGLGWWGLPNLGYKGLAWATFASVTGGAVCNLFILRHRKLLTRASFAPWRWTKRALPYLYKVAWPSGVFQLVWQSGYLALFAIVGSLPKDNVVALAGMTAGLRVESLLFLPAAAFNMTASILIGHHLGAGDPQEAKRNGFRILIIGFVFISCITLILWQFIEPIAGFIAPDLAVRAESVNYLFYNCLAIPFTLTTMVLAGAFNGAGATIFNLVIMGASTWLLRLPLAWLLGHEVMHGPTGIWIAMLSSQMLQASITLYCFSFKNWWKYSMIKNRKPRTTNDAPVV